jgi:periplasmic divalent cation tolerance protein
MVCENNAASLWPGGDKSLVLGRSPVASRLPLRPKRAPMAHVPSHLLVVTTCPDRESADALARGLVGEGLAACVSILPAVRSVYRWKGALEVADELLLLVKTRADRYPAVEAEIRARHPYELPEIVGVPVEAGLAAYLAWVDDCVSPPA